MNGHPLRVLLVEDELLDARIVKAILETHGEVEVVRAKTCARACQLLTERVFDLVVMDLALPDSSGLSTFIRIREAAPKVPAVILASVADELVALRAVGAGAQDYILKGDVDIKTLDRALRVASGRAESGDSDEPRPVRPLPQTETPLRQVLDRVLPFISVLSLDGVVLDISNEALKVAGMSREDVLGRRLIDLPWWAHAENERNRVRNALVRAARGETVRFETTVRLLRGDIRSVAAHFAPLCDAAGSVIQVVASAVDITALKQAQRELARSEARLSEAQRLAHVGSWEWDISLDSLTGSHELYRIYGIERSRFDGKYESVVTHVHPEDREPTQNAIRQVLHNPGPFAYEHRIVRLDGAIRMLHTRGDVVLGHDGKPTRIIGCCWDVTERWEATEKLRRSLSLLQATLEATADGILVIDAARKVTIFNRRFLSLWRLPLELSEGDDEALLGAVLDQVEDRDAFYARVQQLYDQPEADAFDVVKFKDGRTFERYSRPQRVEREIVGRVWSFRDVTQREQLLRAAEHAREDAEHARRKMVNVLERVSDGFVALDRDWRYTYVNECAGRMLGRAPASLIGKHIWTEFPEGTGEKFQRAYERAVAEQKSVTILEYYPPWDRWFENRIYPSADGLSIFFTDVTDQKRSEEQLRASEDQLRALSTRLEAIREDERRQMSREIHDQIGQALTGLKLDLVWLERHADSALSEKVRRRVSDMERLVDETLDTARRLSSELRPPILDDLGLPAAVEWQAQELEARTGIHFDINVPPDGEGVSPPRALALLRILQEALTNVVRHSGAHNARVTLAVEEADVVLTVEDDGCGIAPEAVTRPNALGLLGMKERALVFGGKLTVEGKPGHGTKVEVRVPRDSANIAGALS